MAKREKSNDANHTHAAEDSASTEEMGVATEDSPETIKSADKDTSEHPSEPMKVVSDALKTASEAMGLNGRDSSSGQPQPTDLGEHGFLGRLVYRTSYGVSFGVVYPLALLARLVPMENALVHGLTDGAKAARDAVFQTREEAAPTTRAAAQPA